MPCPTWNLIFFPHSPSLPNNQNHHILKILITMSFLSLYHPLHLYSYQSSSDSFCTIFINGPSVDALVIYCCIINYSKTQTLKAIINRTSLVQETSRYFFWLLLLPLLKMTSGFRMSFSSSTHAQPSPSSFSLNYLLFIFQDSFQEVFCPASPS